MDMVDNRLTHAEVFETLITRVADYLTKYGLKSMVLGVSGGIDSTIVAAICHEVSKRTGIPLIGRSLTMKNTDGEIDSSIKVGEAFCDDFKHISLKGEYQLLLNKLGMDLGMDMQTKIANGNIQARLRMIYLRNLAGVTGGIMMDCDNESERWLGFWTIAGDVGDICPTANLWKHEIYSLAKWLVGYYANQAIGDNCQKCRDMADAIMASAKLAPTDGLGISSSDLEQIGAKSYDDVDDILCTYINCDEGAWENHFKVQMYTKYGRDAVDNVIARHKGSAFKMAQLPVRIEIRPGGLKQRELFE